MMNKKQRKILIECFNIVEGLFVNDGRKDLIEDLTGITKAKVKRFVGKQIGKAFNKLRTVGQNQNNPQNNTNQNKQNP